MRSTLTSKIVECILNPWICQRYCTGSRDEFLFLSKISTDIYKEFRQQENSTIIKSSQRSTLHTQVVGYMHPTFQNILEENLVNWSYWTQIGRHDSYPRPTTSQPINTRAVYEVMNIDITLTYQKKWKCTLGAPRVSRIQLQILD